MMSIETINGIEVHFDVHGSGDPVLFIHGLGSSARDWRLQVEHFSSRHAVITYDVRGHGASEKTSPPYSIRQFARDAKALLDHLGIESACVVGISMGGMIAFQLAVDDPTTVDGLVIVNAVPEFKPRSIGQRLHALQRFLIVRLLGMRSMARVLAPRLFPGPSRARLRQQFIERWSANDKRAYLASMQAIVGWGVAERIPEITIPTLFVAAEHDYTPVALKRSYAEKMPNARLEVIAGSHHATPIEQPDEFNKLIDEFLLSL